MHNKFSGLKAIAIIEASKGLVALLVGLGAHELAGQNLKQVAERLVEHLHLNPASQLPGVILHAVSEVNSSNLAFIAIGATVYSIIRFIEAYGLWRNYRWTEWFAFFSGAIYLPFEIYEIYTHQNLMSVVVLIFNLFVVGYMYNILLKKHQ
ncbi:MAG: DUF2127 domain-containing protein [Psychromonas sp.]